MEHEDYKYQQGLNDVCGIIMVALALELYFLNDSVLGDEEEEEEEEETDEYTIAYEPKKLFAFLHDPSFLDADLYTLFERVMDMGVKQLYFREKRDQEEESFTPKGEMESVKDMLAKSLETTEKKLEDAERRRMIKVLKNSAEENERTFLKKRSNKIVNNYLAEIDPVLVAHLKSLQLEPEMLLLK